MEFPHNDFMRAMAQCGMPPPPFPFPGLPPMEFGKMFQNFHPVPPPIVPPQPDSPLQLRKLFIGGLNHETTDVGLAQYFSQWGLVVDSVVIRDPSTKCSRGFGFITFASVFSVELAMTCKPHVIGGKTVDSKRAIPRDQMATTLPTSFFDSDPSPGCQLTISGILEGIHSVTSLRTYFETFGVLDQVEIRGFHQGFVTFESKESADRCAAHNNGIHVVNDHKVHVKPADIIADPGFHEESNSGSDCEEASEMEEEGSTTMVDDQ